jgi:hypothetical protein
MEMWEWEENAMKTRFLWVLYLTMYITTNKRTDGRTN